LLGDGGTGGDATLGGAGVSADPATSQAATASTSTNQYGFASEARLRQANVRWKRHTVEAHTVPDAAGRAGRDSKQDAQNWRVASRCWGEAGLGQGVRS